MVVASEGLRAQLFTVDGDRPVSMRVRDVSRRGMGLVVRHPVENGQRLRLEIDGQKVFFEVAWHHPYLGIEGMFVCGVFSRQPDLDLVRLLQAVGVKFGESLPF